MNILTLDGHVVETADGGRDGVEKFRKDQFDLVVVDRAMPDMNGDQVASRHQIRQPSDADRYAHGLRLDDGGQWRKTRGR